MKDESEIEVMRDKASTATNAGTKYGGMTYEEGVRNALEWVLGDSDIEDDDLL